MNVAAAVVLLFAEKPQGGSIVSLLIAAGVFVLCAIAGPDLLRKLRKIGPAEFTEEQSKSKLPTIYEEFEQPKVDPAADNPFPRRELTPPEMFEYEKLSHLLYHCFEEVKDPKKDLDPETRQNYRSLIRLVGKAAHAMGHYTKSLDILRHLESLGEGDLDAEELKRLGTAYIWAGFEVEGDKRRECWEKSVDYLNRAKQKNPYNERTLFNLGWVLLSLGKHRGAIECMKASMDQNPEVTPWAKWNIACSQVKLDDKSGAIETLEEIPPGPLWDHIGNDSDFAPLKADPQLGEKFRGLCQERQKSSP